jgi:hypothetical protein
LYASAQQCSEGYAVLICVLLTLIFIQRHPFLYASVLACHFCCKRTYVWPYLSTHGGTKFLLSHLFNDQISCFLDEPVLHAVFMVTVPRENTSAALITSWSALSVACFRSPVCSDALHMRLIILYHFWLHNRRDV